MSSPTPTPSDPAGRLRFTRRNRMSGSTAFAKVFTQGVRKSAGNFTLVCLPNNRTTPQGLPEHRLGLSIGKRVGPAVRRVAVKRRIREAFRLSRPHLPAAAPQAYTNPPADPSSHVPVCGGYDWIIAARPHAPMPTAEYAAILLTLAARAAREWDKRHSKLSSPQQNTPESGP